ncbi:IS1595 family transposase ISSsu9 [Paenibacillus allorhizoplanae]|uniref:Dihydrofolate reductase n=1 Tax=Paenibacillus allorhizoplanae TaxID=2905648 RepID=A0ABN8GLV4_9BACL|nr:MULTISPECIES: dihydrofolate reductase [Paenibacillus]KRE75741.1 dihydrofolate reductase [Paenibacillus sp. Soil750]CAH1212314.1 IS1595 family transposase ISSsu9 [Paenibacillus allorhizoplanae]
MSISFIFAMDRNRAIGVNNKLPWHLPGDLKFFKNVTMGHPILMGRKTYESIGKPLPGRRNVILTQNTAYQAEGCEVIHSVDEAIDAFRDQELFVIGGAEIFKLFASHVNRMYITYIEDEFEADTFMSDLDLSNWTLVSSEQGERNEKNPYEYYFRIYERN